MLTTEHLLMFCRTSLAVVFLLSFVGKVRSVAAFEAAVAGFRLLSTVLVPAATRLLLWSELVVVVLLLAGGIALVPGFALAAGLLIVFSGGLVVVLWRGQALSCNCFGAKAQRVTPYDLLRNALLLGLCAAGFAARVAATPPLFETLVLAAAATGVGMLFAHFADVIGTLLNPFTP